MLRPIVVFGTRPEAVKMAPIVKKLRAAGGEPIVCVTGQHREILQQVLDVFDIRPDYDLRVMQANQSLAHITASVLTGLGPVLQESSASLMLVQGDTTTAMAASLCAFYQRVPIAHVEAGLRTGRRDSPFPEEMNRVLSDYLADIHFPPTGRARATLVREAVQGDIFVTGNTVVDALRWMVAGLGAEAPSAALADLAELGGRLVLVTGHRRESFGEGFDHICAALRSVSLSSEDVQIVYPVHPNPRVWGPVTEALGSLPRVHLIDPLPYHEFVWLLQRSHLVLTDSGGVQEEAAALGKPVLIMRESTERMEGVDAGVAELVGTDTASIVRGVHRLLSDSELRVAMSRACDVYGDGRAAERIVDYLQWWSGDSGEKPQEWVYTQ